jgi:hypothetical protein
VSSGALTAMPRVILPMAAHVPTRRTVLGMIAVVLATTGLAWRIRAISREPRVILAPRAVQLMYNRMLSLRIQRYAARYGRPAFRLDSVLAHLDSTDARVVSDLSTDLWGDEVAYRWSFCSFTLVSRAGQQYAPPSPAPAESLRAGQLSPPGAWVEEEYAWPTGVGRKERCGEP